MEFKKIIAVVSVLLLSFGLFSCAKEAPKQEQPKPAGLSEADVLAIATEVYIYGYPLVTMEMTRRVLTNVAVPEAQKAPMGRIARLREYPTPADREVTAPNADTLYTLAWLDVSKEPWVFSIPDMKGRYYLMPMLSGWTDVFQVPGTRTTGTKAQKYAITGPGWSGTLPEGVAEYKSPTGIVWILGRIYCTGTPQDFRAVHALQDRFELVPLSALGKPYTPPEGMVDPTVDSKTAVRHQVHKMDGGAYFKLLAELMKTNPPTKEDAPLVEKMAKIGIIPGKDFDPGKAGPSVAKALQAVPKAAQERIMSQMQAGWSVNVNGWSYRTKGIGIYGTDYLQRAFVTAVGLGANRPEDAIYPTSEADDDGKPYEGSNKYVMRFEKGQMPPAEAFWSLTLYDDKFFFVPNRLNRYTLSSRSKLKPNRDGSVDLYIQKASPGKAREANWLPAPEGRFVLMLRIYAPRATPPSIIDGSWKPPAVRQVQK